MGTTWPICSDDRLALEKVRDQLKSVRQATGLTYEQAGAVINRSGNFLYEMENLRSALKMSSLQQWAHIYDMRIEFTLAGFWNFSWPNDEIRLLHQLSRPFGVFEYQRLWLVSALQAWRERIGFSANEVGYWLGLKDGAVSEWERSSADPFMLRAMAQARLTGTSVEMDLWTKEAWIFT